MNTGRRKSRRAPKKLSKYNEGDLVEIIRGEKALKARLAQLLTAGTSPNPRWLIKFEGPYKDEEVYEKTFGQVLESSVVASEQASSGPEDELVELSQEPSTAVDSSTDNQTSARESTARDDRNKRREHFELPAVVKKSVMKKETVTKVKLLTGTLYLYRGPNRRAEFIPRM